MFKAEITKKSYELVDDGEYNVVFVGAEDFDGKYPGLNWHFEITDKNDKRISKLTGRNISSASNLGVMLTGMTGKTIAEVLAMEDINMVVNNLEGKTFKAFISHKESDKGTFNTLEKVYLKKNK